MSTTRKLKIILCIMVVMLLGFIRAGAEEFRKAKDLEKMGKNIFCVSSVDDSKSFFTLSKDVIKINTAIGMDSYGRLECYNRDNLELDVNVVIPPEKGEVEWRGTSYIYRPYPGQKGEDSFSFCVSDINGDISQTGIAKISIDENVGVYYADMQKNPYQYSAIKMASDGIIDGENIGGVHLFYPQKEVSGGQYIIMLLATMNEVNTEPCVNTGLKNDSNIPIWLKPYIKKAIDLGIILEDKFSAFGTITRAEAVVLTNRAAKIPKVERASVKIFDKNNIPDWAVQSYINMFSYNMLELYDGSAYPNIPLKKDYCAAILRQLKLYLDKF